MCSVILTLERRGESEFWMAKGGGVGTRSTAASPSPKLKKILSIQINEQEVIEYRKKVVGEIYWELDFPRQ